MTPPAPLVSIVVPVLNGERHLRDSLESILAQTYEPVEVIVMDDCSTDGTVRILREYRDRISHHRQPAAKGQFANVNDGIALARGAYVAVYHSDDVYEPEIVAREVEHLQLHPHVGAVFAKDTFIDVNGRPFGRLELPAEIASQHELDYAAVLEALLRYKNTFLRCPSGMVRASVYREGGYDDQFENSSDLEMWLRIARRHKIGIIDEHLFRYRRGHGTESERYDALRTEPECFFRILDRELERGGRVLVSDDALATYEGHRADDQLRISPSRYIVGRSAAARDALRDVSPRVIMASRHPRRARLLAFTSS